MIKHVFAQKIFFAKIKKLKLYEEHINTNSLGYNKLQKSTS